MSKELMNEYGVDIDLQEIIENLAVFCLSVGANVNDIQIVLPKKALDSYHKKFGKISAHHIIGKPPTPGEDTSMVKQSTVGSGTLHLYSSETHQVLKR